MSSSTTPTPGLPAAAAGKKRATPEGGHAPAPPSQRIKARKTAQSIVVQPVVASTATKKPQQQQQQQPNAHILRSVLPARIAESRAFELTAMHAVMRRSTDLAKSRAFQKVPRYLRRRAASHNPLKVPRALRDRALREIDIPNDDQRRRRKPKALRRKPRSDFISRQRRNGRWLETHLWHAKRFHLVPRWGWKVPDRPTQKGDRAAYRSAEHAVVARDLSWTSRYAFSGASADDIATVVSAVADPLGPRVGAARYRHGARAVDLDLYDAYPRGFLGPATAVWRPFSSSDPTHVLWLALHPAAEDAFLLAVAAALDRLKMTSVLVDQVTDVGRIELTGPKAMAIVHSVLHPARSAMTDAENAAWDTTRGICSPAALAPGQVLGVRVWDPRLRYSFF
ncbi:ribonucleases P/MRP protein subunit POP1-domain-containing protein, partial [Blastocladiella britannica]